MLACRLVVVHVSWAAAAAAAAVVQVVVVAAAELAVWAMASLLEVVSDVRRRCSVWRR